MKQTLQLNRSFVCGLVAAVLVVVSRAESPGMVDFGKFTPAGNGGEFVEVQLRSNLLQFAARIVEKEQPEAAKLLRSVELVRVNVIGLTDANRQGVQERVQKIRQDLESRGWERNVDVKDKGGENVEVYTQAKEGDALAGIVVTVIHPNEAVLANVVGDIRPEQIAALAESLNIKSLKELHHEVKK